MKKSKRESKHQYRIVTNDMEYERVDGLRKAREQIFTAKVLAVLGIPALFLYGLGLVFFFIAGLFWVNAKSLEAKFKE